MKNKDFLQWAAFCLLIIGSVTTMLWLAIYLFEGE
jgi:hypothetical protein